MYDAILTHIADRMHSYGETLQPPCPEACLMDFKRRAGQELGCDIPAQYIAFLAKANGLDWNGIVVYASKRTPIADYPDRMIDGMVEANLEFRGHVPMRNYLVFADDGVALFTYNMSNTKFEAVTRVGLTVLECFDSFDEMLARALLRDT